MYTFVQNFKCDCILFTYVAIFIVEAQTCAIVLKVNKNTLLKIRTRCTVRPWDFWKCADCNVAPVFQHRCNCTEVIVASTYCSNMAKHNDADAVRRALAWTSVWHKLGDMLLEIDRYIGWYLGFINTLISAEKTDFIGLSRC